MKKEIKIPLLYQHLRAHRHFLAIDSSTLPQCQRRAITCTKVEVTEDKTTYISTNGHIALITSHKAEVAGFAPSEIGQFLIPGDLMRDVFMTKKKMGRYFGNIVQAYIDDKYNKIKLEYGLDDKYQTIKVGTLNDADMFPKWRKLVAATEKAHKPKKKTPYTAFNAKYMKAILDAIRDFTQYQIRKSDNAVPVIHNPSKPSEPLTVTIRRDEHIPALDSSFKAYLMPMDLRNKEERGE